MKLSHISGVLALSLAVIFSFSTAQAANGTFKGKSQGQHELTDWEQNKMNAEFDSKFTGQASGSFQKLTNNPWEAKKNKMKQHSQKMLQLSNTWSHCREYAYKQRGQCYARGGDAYTCERYSDARVNHCDDKF